MSRLRDLVRRVVLGTVTPSQVLDEVRAQAPKSAAWNRSHSWWACEGNEILETIISVSKGKVFLSPQAAVQVAAGRMKGKVVSERVAGLQLYRVLPVDQATEVVVERIIEAALPADWIEPTWEPDLPTLEVVRREVDRLYLRRLLTKNAWNISASAREGGVARQTLHALLKQHGFTRPGSADQVEHEMKAEAA